MGVSSFASGALVSSAGWEKMNLGAIPVLAVALGAVLWLALSPRCAGRLGLIPLQDAGAAALRARSAGPAS